MACAPALLLPACAGPQSTLDPQGPVAAGIATAWWIMAIGAAVVLAVVMALALYATFGDPARRRRLAPNAFLAVAGILCPSMVLAALLVYGTDLGRRITQDDPGALRIEVTAQRWRWQVHYPAGREGPAVDVADELYLPAGRTVEIIVRSRDVIHAFWVPNLAGKVDMIPGMENRVRLVAQVPGRWRGQCAEFCGAQHAHMSFIVTVLEEDEFARWRLQRARATAAALAQAGPPAMQREPAR